MTEGEGETLRYVEGEDVDVGVVIPAEPLEGFFGLRTRGDEIEVFTGGDEVGVQCCRVVDCDCYSG